MADKLMRALAQFDQRSHRFDAEFLAQRTLDLFEHAYVLRATLDVREEIKPGKPNPNYLSWLRWQESVP